MRFITPARGILIAAIFSATFFSGAMHLNCEESRIVEGNARFTVIAPECIRMEYSREGIFIDDRSYFAVNREAGFKGHSLTKKAGSLEIDTGIIKLTYIPDGKSFNDENLKAEIRKGGSIVEWKPGMENSGNLGGTIRTVDGVYGPVDLGQGFLSRDGWFLLDDSEGVLLTEDWVRSRPENAGKDWYLFGYGYDYKAALKAMVTVGGEIPMPRKYSLGVWYSRYWAYSSDDYRNIVKEYYDQDFPLDVMVLDMDWHKDGWTGWSWNRKLLPDAPDLLKWFHDKKLFVTLNVHPADGIGPHEDMYEAFMEEMGADPASGKTLLYDAGSKKYLDTLFKHTHVPHEDEGTDFWWLDWQQYKYTRSIPDLTNLAWLNQYYYQHTQRSGLRGQSFSRWAGYGDHRHPIHFSGDSDSGWPMLAFEIPFTSTAGNVGCFFWSHDIGGHMGRRIPESYTRWSQFGATTAALRSHSTKSPELDRRPWKYPKWAENSMRKSFHLRSEIFPYIYSSVRQSCRDTIPLNVPMYVEYPEDERSYRNPQQYFFGDHLLVAPIVSPGYGKRRVGLQTVWFPESGWYNWFTGEKYEANTEAIVAADIDEFPMYARAGVPIPTQPYTQRMSTELLDELVIRCYPGNDGETGEFVLYEDDGESKAYMNGEFSETKLSCSREGDTISVTVAPAAGSYKGMVENRAYIIEIPATEKAETALVNGEKAGVEYDENKSMNRIMVEQRSVSEETVVSISAKQVSQEYLKERAALARAAGMTGMDTTGKSLKGVVSEYADSGPDEDVLNALLGVAGVGSVRKNEGVYLYEGEEKGYFFARPGILDDDTFSYTYQERIGDEKKQLSKKDVKVEKPASYSAPEGDPIDGNGLFGLPAKRVAIVDFSINGHPFTLEETVEKEEHYLTKWNIIGPFDFKRDIDISKQNFGPQEIVDLSKTYDGIGGQGIKWRRATCNTSGILDLFSYYYFDFRIAYATTFVYSKADQESEITISSDGGIEAWANGEKLVSMNRSAGMGIGDSVKTIKVNLKKGRNVLLLKSSHYWDSWKLRASIEAQRPIKQSYK